MRGKSYENNLLPYCDRLAPWKCRILALNGRRPLTTKELAEKSGLSRGSIKRLTRADSWIGFEMATIVKFTTACGVDLLHQKRPLQKLQQIMRASKGPPHLSTPQRKYWASVFKGEKNWQNRSADNAE